MTPARSGFSGFSKGPLGARRAIAAYTPRVFRWRSPTRRFLDAVAAGDLEAVRAWLARDPGLIQARDGSGRTAFAVACLARHLEVGRLLRERGYEPDLRESVLVADWERFEALASQAPGLINQDHPVGGTAMCAAAYGGGGNQVWRTYNYGGDPNVHSRENEGNSVVRAALELPDLALAEITAASFLSNGADPNLPEAGGSSALHAAAARGSTELVEMLIRKGARVDARDAAGRTPLELALERGERATTALLSNHRDILRDCYNSREAQDADGNAYRALDLSAFSYADRGAVVGAAHAKFDDLRAAVERNPRLAHSVATTTERAVEAGAHMGRTDIVEFLLEHGAPYSMPTAVMRNDLPRARVLLEQDPRRFHERGAHDFPLLWYPVIGRGLLEMTELLIERGAEVNRVGRKFDGAGQTPLQIAQARGHDSVVRPLEQRGAR